MTYFLRHQCSCSWVENSSKTTPETPHRYSFDDERQHAMSRRNISRKRIKKKNDKTQSLSQLAEQTDGKQSSRSLLTRLRIRDSDLSSTSTEEELGQATSILNWFSILLLCGFVLKCKLCCYSSISLLSSSSNTNDFLVVSKSNDVTSV